MYSPNRIRTLVSPNFVKIIKEHPEKFPKITGYGFAEEIPDDMLCPMNVKVKFLNDIIAQKLGFLRSSIVIKNFGDLRNFLVEEAAKFTRTAREFNISAITQKSDESVRRVCAENGIRVSELPDESKSWSFNVFGIDSARSTALDERCDKILNRKENIMGNPLVKFFLKDRLPELKSIANKMVKEADAKGLKSSVDIDNAISKELEGTFENLLRTSEDNPLDKFINERVSCQVFELRSEDGKIVPVAVEEKPDKKDTKFIRKFFNMESFKENLLCLIEENFSFNNYETLPKYRNKTVAIDLDGFRDKMGPVLEERFQNLVNEQVETMKKLHMSDKAIETLTVKAKETAAIKKAEAYNQSVADIMDDLVLDKMKKTISREQYHAANLSGAELERLLLENKKQVSDHMEYTRLFSALAKGNERRTYLDFLDDIDRANFREYGELSKEAGDRLAYNMPEIIRNVVRVVSDSMSDDARKMFGIGQRETR